jgi:hypothetical protein
MDTIAEKPKQVVKKKTTKVETEKKDEYPFDYMVGDSVHFLAERGGEKKDLAAIVARVWANGHADLHIFLPQNNPPSFMRQVPYDSSCETINTFHRLEDDHKHTWG